jgi:hypothetical protein
MQSMILHEKQSSLCRGFPGTLTYSSTIASVGQTSLQVPQSVHASLFILKMSSPSLMASEGHSSAQVPHATQSSVILRATLSPPYLKIFAFVISI